MKLTPLNIKAFQELKTQYRGYPCCLNLHEAHDMAIFTFVGDYYGKDDLTDEQQLALDHIQEKYPNLFADAYDSMMQTAFDF